MKYVALLILIAFAGCQRSTPTTFHIDVNTGSLVDANHREHTLSFKTPPNAEVTVEADGSKSVVSVDELNSDGLFTVTLAVTREASDVEGKSKFKTLIRPQAKNGAFAGGPSTYTLDSDLDLTEILLVDAETGEYPIGKTFDIGTENGQPIRLTVRSTKIDPSNGG